jgi:hypothetical protein
MTGPKQVYPHGALRPVLLQRYEERAAHTWGTTKRAALQLARDIANGNVVTVPCEHVHQALWHAALVDGDEYEALHNARAADGAESYTVDAAGTYTPVV